MCFPEFAGMGLPSKQVPEDVGSGISYLLTAPPEVLLDLTGDKLPTEFSQSLEPRLQTPE